jgi:hypothetical protein
VITIHVVDREDGTQTVEFRTEIGQVIAKVYAAPDGQTIRVAMPEFKVFSQLRLEPDLHFIDIYRKVEWAAQARERRKIEESKRK